MTQKYSMEGVEDYDRASPRHHASQRAQPSRARYDQAKHNHRSTEAARYSHMPSLIPSFLQSFLSRPWHGKKPPWEVQPSARFPKRLA
jgi:hypothetical protein